MPKYKVTVCIEFDAVIEADSAYEAECEARRISYMDIEDYPNDWIANATEIKEYSETESKDEESAS